MTNVAQKQEMVAIKKGIMAKFPLMGPVIARVPFQEDNHVKTAATNGHQVFYSTSYTCQLTFEEKIFLFAHEIMHIAFDHVMRSGDKDPEIWNYATDAVINQMLKASGLPMPAGGIDIPEAAGKSVDEVYENLIQANYQQKHVGVQGQHGLWEDAVKEAAKKQNKQMINPQISAEREKQFMQTNEAFKQEQHQAQNVKLTKCVINPNRSYLKNYTTQLTK